MKTCPFEERVERWVDGEESDPALVERHVRECATCADHVHELEAMRGLLKVPGEVVEIADAQMPAFLEGIGSGIERSPRRHTGLWAMASLCAAALIVAVSFVLLASDGPTPVQAHTIVESLSTDIDGATTTSYHDDTGTTTVWINVPDGDMW